MLDLSNHIKALLSLGDHRVDRCLKQLGVHWESDPIAPEILAWPPKIVERAFELTRSLGDNKVGEAHLLLAIVASYPMQVAELFGIDRTRCGLLREALYSALMEDG